MIPKVSGLDTSPFNDWDWNDTNKRKTLHLQCARSGVEQVQELYKIAKKRILWNKWGGSDARVSNVITTKNKRKRGPKA